MPGRYSQHQARRGITLLEVLVSIGVLSIGMLGAATMLPLAKYYSAEASKYDRASTLGAQAYHDMQIRGYLSPKKWIDPAGSFNFTNASVVMVDPLAMTYASETYASTAATVSLAPVFFPALPTNNPNPPVPTAPIVFRTNVDITNNWPDAAPLPKSANGGVAMPFSMADRIFRSNDDLVFDVPSRSDRRPQTPTGWLSPDYSGDYSWLVTVSHPAVDLFNAPNMQRLECSLVVFYKRDVNLNPSDWPGPPTNKKPPPERMVYADFLQQPANGVPFFSGGTVRLRTIGTGTPPMTTQVQAQTNWLDGLKPNTYVMLSAMFNSATGSGLPPFPRVGWYRIISVDEGAQVVGNSASRIITLDGDDWSAMNDNNGNPLWQDGDAGQNTSPTVFCTIADGAVAVYNDSILLDGSVLRD
jgi:type II secretory pathway pseudopilin PulG